MSATIGGSSVAAGLPPLLLPAPRELIQRPGSCRVGGVDFRADPTLPGEGFVLELSADGCVIFHADAAGQRHGAACLAQLRAQYGVELPCLRISDAPAFALRGVMLDISRDRIPTFTELVKLLHTLAGWRINHVQLYCENAIAYAGHVAAWRAVDPFTLSELAALASIAADVGIDLVANQNTFGHLERWLIQPAYAHLAEIQPGDRWRFADLDWRTTPHSLCPGDPAGLALVGDWLAQLAICLPSALVNIGCDETYDVGFGRSRAAVAARGRAAVYGDYVAAVCARVKALGKRPLFWADIALEHPECLVALPDDLIALCWGYEPDAPFARWLQQCRPKTAWVSPGTACWLTTAGRTAERRANLLAAATQGVAGGATGYLITAWGDQGHRQAWSVTLHALAEGAHRAWSGTAAYDPRASSLHAFGDATLRTGPWLDALGDSDQLMRANGGKIQADGSRACLRNRSALYHDLHLPWQETWVGEHRDWEKVAARVAACGPAPQLANAQLQAELEWTLDYSRLAAARALLRRQKNAPRSAATVWIAAFDDLVTRHAGQWAARARLAGLPAAQHWWQRIRTDAQVTGAAQDSP